ncbi:MAG: serine/threonine-protein kinase, partial [Acidobacteriota bacterium]
NVVALFDADEAEGVLYLAFEYVEGLDLSQRVGVPPLLSLRQVLTIGREVAMALDYAHRSDIVHRDIKPSNILLGPGGEAKVADFGIAKLSGSTELTRTGSVVGSPQYMSPEQVRGEALDGRSDLFSLGVVLYELLCRARPFGGDTISTLVYEILAKEPHTVDQLRPGLPPRLVSLVHGLLAKDRQHRPTTGAHVIAELNAIVAETPSELLDGPAAPPAGDEGETIRMPSSGGMTGAGPVPAPGSSSSVRPSALYPTSTLAPAPPSSSGVRPPDHRRRLPLRRPLRLLRRPLLPRRGPRRRRRHLRLRRPSPRRGARRRSIRGRIRSRARASRSAWRSPPSSWPPPSASSPSAPSSAALKIRRRPPRRSRSLKSQNLRRQRLRARRLKARSPSPPKRRLPPATGRPRRRPTRP